MITRLVVSLRKAVDASFSLALDGDRSTAVESDADEMADVEDPSLPPTPFPSFFCQDSKQPSRTDLPSSFSET